MFMEGKRREEDEGRRNEGSEGKRREGVEGKRRKEKRGDRRGREVIDGNPSVHMICCADVLSMLSVIAIGL